MFKKFYTACFSYQWFYSLVQPEKGWWTLTLNKSSFLHRVRYQLVHILTLRSVDIAAFTLVSWRVPSTLLIGLCRYCLGGNGGGEVVRGDNTNTGDVRLRFRDGNGGAWLELFIKWLNEEQSDNGDDVWRPNREGRVESGGGGGGVGASWKQSKHTKTIH